MTLKLRGSRLAPAPPPPGLRPRSWSGAHRDHCRAPRASLRPGLDQPGQVPVPLATAGGQPHAGRPPGAAATPSAGSAEAHS